jgi:hypothetical protein
MDLLPFATALSTTLSSWGDKSIKRASGSGALTTVRHERGEGRKGLEVCNCSTDEGRPLGTGLQERVPNHLRRLWSKAMVVSTEGKGLERTRSGDWQEEDRKGTTDDVSKA